MKINNDDVAALIGTFVFHLSAFLLLFFGVLKASVPQNDGSIPVMFDQNTVAIASPAPTATVPTESVTTTTKTPATATKATSSQPTRTPATTQRTPTSRTPTTTTATKNITQDKVETVSVPDNSKQTNTSVADEAARKEREEAERLRKEEAERQRIAEEQQKQQEAISSRVSNAFSANNAQENSQSRDAATPMAQSANPFNNQESGASRGVDHISFNLGGRTSVGPLPRPVYTEREEGKIVVNITVDQNGNVISAEIGRGTNIDNRAMRNNTLEAAKNSKFSKISGSNNQSGTITYTYKLT